MDLYRTVKGILPDKYQKELFGAVENNYTVSTVEGLIDILIFERATGRLERLVRDKVLERSSKRFRDILAAFSSSRRVEAEWAHKQVLIGFEEEVNALSEELLRVFPNAHIAFASLCKGEYIEDIRVDMNIFFEMAREGYVDNRGGSDVLKVNYRHTLQAYLATSLGWNRGPARENLLGEMKRIFLSKLGIIFEHDRWVGKALKRG